jgi:hypothetical protein
VHPSSKSSSFARAALYKASANAQVAVVSSPPWKTLHASKLHLGSSIGVLSFWFWLPKTTGKVYLGEQTLSPDRFPGPDAAGGATGRSCNLHRPLLNLLDCCISNVDHREGSSPCRLLALSEMKGRHLLALIEIVRINLLDMVVARMYINRKNLLHVVFSL